MSKLEIERTTLEFVEKLETTEQAPDAMALFQRYADGLGFSFATCLKVPEVGEDLAACLLMCNYPPEWIAHYGEKGYVKHDPMVRELFRTYHPYTWSEVRTRREVSHAGSQVLNEASDFGFNEGFVVPIYEASGYTGLVSLAGRNVVILEETRNALTLACIYLHSKLSTLRRRTTDVDFALTDREHECLAWAAAGKSDWEIGQILTISSKTVNYHIENAKRKFGVATRVQAIIVAMRHGKLAG